MSVPPRSLDQDPLRERAVRRAALGAAFGTFVEWFDYFVYGLLAATLGRVFFPSEDPTVSLLAAFAVFGVAFLFRPLGGLFFGSLGDRYGRKNTLATVVIVMSASTFLIGVLPSYASIGIAAPVLLVLLRLAQGFSTGGEIGGALTLLVEYAPDHRRGFFAGFVTMSSYAGAVAGSVLILALTGVFGDAALAEWAWRVPFLIAAPLGLVGLYLRLRLEDTPSFRALAQNSAVASAPLKDTLRLDQGRVVLCAGLAVLHAFGAYVVLTYVPNYLSVTVGLSETASFVITTVITLVAVVVVAPVTLLSDRIGRKPVVTGACIAYVVFPIPAFLLLSSGGGIGAALVAGVMLGVTLGAYGSVAYAAMIELFPTRTRYTAFSLGLNVPVSVLGGLAPLLAATVVELSGSAVAPGFLIIIAALVSLVACLALRETATQPLRQE